MDASASRIAVFLSSTLLSLSVLDNGPGVSKEDLEVMCSNHYTSKVATLEDIRRCGTISGLGTFGFRGEALHSIGVSGRLSITTKRQGDSFGYRASYRDVELVELRKVARDEPGLLVEVEDLFYRNDVRREHFYRNKAECLKCIELIKSYGCVYSGISMAVDDKVVVPADDSPKDVVLPTGGRDGDGVSEEASAENAQDDNRVSGPSPQKVCMEIRRDGLAGQEGSESARENAPAPVACIPEQPSGGEEDGSGSIRNKIDYIARAFFGNSSVARDLEYRRARNYLLICSNRNLSLKKYKCIVFVNRRLVRNDILKKRVFLKYKGLLREGEYPFVYLEIGCDCVDVNVHPSKAEVLVGDGRIYEQAVQAAEEILANETQRIRNLVGELRPNTSPGGRPFMQLPLEISGEGGLQNGTSSVPSRDCARATASNPSISAPWMPGRGDLGSTLQHGPSNSCNPAGHGTYPGAVSSEPEIKIYTSSRVRTIEESISRRSCPTKRYSLVSLKTLQDAIKEVDTGFFRTLVYVGCAGEHLFAQSHTNLIGIQRQVFLKEAFYTKLLMDFGNFESRAIPPCRIEVDAALAPMLLDYFKIRVEGGCVVAAPVIFGVCAEEWGSFSAAKTTEMETIGNVALGVAEIYKNAEIDSKIFNLIKSDVVGTRGLIQSCSVIVALRDLYKKFGRC